MDKRTENFAGRTMRSLISTRRTSELKKRAFELSVLPEKDPCHNGAEFPTGLTSSRKIPQAASPSLGMHAAVHNTFNLQRHLISRPTLRIFRAEGIGKRPSPRHET
jgi:hypothetical protein